MAVPVIRRRIKRASRRRRGRYEVVRNALIAIAVVALMAAALYYLLMVFSLFSRKSKGLAMPSKPSSSSHGTPSAAVSMEDRLRGALWSFFAGDALSSPTHWYYGGIRQIVAHYGHEIRDYEQPKHHLQGSILNKSNLNGGGRAAFGNGSVDGKTTIIGDVINHGKKHLWDPKEQIHYHATLHKGENTLEVQLARVLMKSIVDNHGKFDADHFRKAYVDFMTTPGSHNDTYASTCHRMFFANLVYRKLDPKDCPDNDSHNVDTIDGIVLPTIAALATASNPQSTMDDIASASSRCAAVTRKSRQLEDISGVWGQFLAIAIREDSDEAVTDALANMSKQLTGRRPAPQQADEMTACYLGSSLPALINTIALRGPEHNVWNALLANANVGGENVHRGSVLGAALGSRVGNSNLPNQLRDGLYQHEKLDKEIEDFITAVTRKTANAAPTE